MSLFVSCNCCYDRLQLFGSFLYFSCIFKEWSKRSVSENLILNLHTYQFHILSNFFNQDKHWTGVIEPLMHNVQNWSYRQNFYKVYLTILRCYGLKGVELVLKLIMRLFFVSLFFFVTAIIACCNYSYLSVCLLDI